MKKVVGLATLLGFLVFADCTSVDLNGDEATSPTVYNTMGDAKGPSVGNPDLPEVGPPKPIGIKRGLQPRKQRLGLETRRKFNLKPRPRP